jgi:hypothetical protein
MSMGEPTASTIHFEVPDPSAPGGPWPLGIVVTGTGFAPRGLPLLACVGSVAAEAILLFPDGSGFSGYLARMPNEGDALAIGFAQLAATDLVYHSGDIA